MKLKLARPAFGRKPEPVPNCLAVQVGDTWRYWGLDGSGRLEDLPQPPTRCVLWRVCEYDVLAPSGGRSAKGLGRLGRELLKERVAQFTSGEWAVFTRQGNETIGGHPSRPLALALRDRLKDLPAPSVLQAELPGGYTALAIYRRDQTVTGWTLASGEDIEITQARLVQQSGVSDAGTESFADLWALLENAPPSRDFPVEPEWRGIPVRQYRRAALLASTALLALSVVHLGIEMSAQALSGHRARLAATRLDAAKVRVIAWDRTHAEALARQGGIRPDSLIAAASAVYQPGSSVSLTQKGREIVVMLPLHALSPIAPGQWTPASAIRAGLAKRPPRGWRLYRLARAGEGRFALIYRHGSLMP